MSELQERRRLVITTRVARVLESPGLEDERVTNDGFLWKRTVLDSCFILLVQIMRRQKPTLDVSQAQSIPLYFPLVDLRENHFFLELPKSAGPASERSASLDISRTGIADIHHHYI